MIQKDNLPAALRETGLFCCWRYEERDGKHTKVPYNPRTGGKAQSTNPQTFAPLAVALASMERSGYDGNGVGIFGNLGAIDIDHCIGDTGELSEMAAEIVDTMQAYTEYSPSGKGLRILFTVSEGFQYDKARYYINNQRVGLEVCIAGHTNKYVTVTGNDLPLAWIWRSAGSNCGRCWRSTWCGPRHRSPHHALHRRGLPAARLIWTIWH